MIDIHSHVMPGVDDGARDVDEAVGALRSMQAEGVTHVLATPHLDGSLTTRPAALAARLGSIDAGWHALRAAAATLDATPTLGRGAEVMLDSPEPDLGDARLRLDGTDFVLVEFPWTHVPPNSTRAVEWIRAAGYIPVIAHPERYPAGASYLRTIEEWRRRGAYLQCNCGSLTGAYGVGVRRMATDLLRRGWIDYLAGDYHARGPLPQRSCAEALGQLESGEELVGVLLTVNPGRLRENKAPLPVAPVPARDALWQRITNVFR